MRPIQQDDVQDYLDGKHLKPQRQWYHYVDENGKVYNASARNRKDIVNVFRARFHLYLTRSQIKNGRKNG